MFPQFPHGASESDQPDDQRIERHPLGEATAVTGQKDEERTGQHSKKANNTRED